MTAESFYWADGRKSGVITGAGGFLLSAERDKKKNWDKKNSYSQAMCFFLSRFIVLWAGLKKKTKKTAGVTHKHDVREQAGLCGWKKERKIKTVDN